MGEEFSGLFCFSDDGADMVAVLEGSGESFETDVACYADYLGMVSWGDVCFGGRGWRGLTRMTSAMIESSDDPGGRELLGKGKMRRNESWGEGIRISRGGQLIFKQAQTEGEQLIEQDIRSGQCRARSSGCMKEREIEIETDVPVCS